MIVDVHYHYFGRFPTDEAIARRMVQGLLDDGERAGMKKTVDEILPVFRDMVEDPEGDKLVRRMDEAGIDVTAICVVDNVEMGAADDRILTYNERCAAVAAKHPGRLISLAGIDPRRPEAPSMFRQCITDFGMKGLKWHPDNGYYPNSPEAYAVLKVAVEFGLPLLTHCSPLPHSRAKYAQPIHLDDVAVDFPELEIIAAHMGNGWWRDWAAIAQYKKTVSGDLAMWQFLPVNHPARFRSYLREITDLVGPDQVLFATDGPVFEGHVSNKAFVAAIKGLTTTGDESGIVFTQEEVDAILGGNAARIFKLQ